MNYFASWHILPYKKNRSHLNFAVKLRIKTTTSPMENDQNVLLENGIWGTACTMQNAQSPVVGGGQEGANI